MNTVSNFLLFLHIERFSLPSVLDTLNVVGTKVSYSAFFPVPRLDASPVLFEDCFDRKQFALPLLPQPAGSIPPSLSHQLETHIEFGYLKAGISFDVFLISFL